MAIPAYIEKVAQSRDKRQSMRRKLRLQLPGTKINGVEVEVLLHNISATGLLLEGEVGLAPGHWIDVTLPHAGVTRARVVWISGVLCGCEFDTPISPATLSAAQLRGVGDAPPNETDFFPKPVTDSFGVRLHRLRTIKRLTQVQIAAELGVSEQSISAWEQDKARPKAGRMKALAILLGVPISELLGIDEPVSIGDVVARAKAQIAEAADVSADNVKIIIEI